MSELSDEEMLSLFRGAEPGEKSQAFNLIFRKYKESVYHLIRRMVIDHDDTDDLVQNTFVNIWNNLDKFREESKLYTWIYRIATTKSIDFIRSKKSKKRFAFIYRLGAPGDKENVSIPDFHHPGVVSERKEQAAQLFQAIAQLPENQKTAFILTRLEQLSHAAVAEIMGITVPAVESLLHRGRVNLKKLLDKKADLM